MSAPDYTPDRPLFQSGDHAMQENASRTGSKHIADCLGSVEWAARIVACVNACRGISDPETAVTLLKDDHARALKAERQRDQVMKAMGTLIADLQNALPSLRIHLNWTTEAEDKAIAEANALIDEITGKVAKPTPEYAVVRVTRDDGSPAKTLHLYPGDTAEIEVDSSVAVQQGRRLLEAAHKVSSSFGYAPGKGPDWYEAIRDAIREVEGDAG